MLVGNQIFGSYLDESRGGGEGVNPEIVGSDLAVSPICCQSVENPCDAFGGENELVVSRLAGDIHDEEDSKGKAWQHQGIVGTLRRVNFIPRRLHWYAVIDHLCKIWSEPILCVHLVSNHNLEGFMRSQALGHVDLRRRQTGKSNC